MIYLRCLLYVLAVALAALAGVVFARSAYAVERTPARLGAGVWIVGAGADPGVDRICFVRGEERLICAEPLVLASDELEVEGRRVRITSPPGLARAALVKLTLLESATIRAIACRRMDGLDLCSPPSPDTYTLAVLQAPIPPGLLDLILSDLSAAEAALIRIRHEIEAAQGGAP